MGNKKPQYCKNILGRFCIHAEKDLGWNFGCKTCTKWNKDLQKNEFCRKKI